MNLRFTSVNKAYNVTITLLLVLHNVVAKFGNEHEVKTLDLSVGLKVKLHSC